MVLDHVNVAVGSSKPDDLNKHTLQVPALLSSAERAQNFRNYRISCNVQLFLHH